MTEEITGTYGEILEEYEKMELVYTGVLSNINIPRLGAEFAAPHYERIMRQHWEDNGKRGKFDYIRYARKNPDIRESAREEIIPLFKEHYMAQVKRTLDMNKKLWEMSEAYTEEPCNEWVELRRSSTSTYNSQGYGKHKYARNALTSYEVALEMGGIEYEVRAEVESYGSEYVLYGKCTKALLDALIRRSAVEIKETTEERLRQNSVNSKVYWPK